MLRPNFAATIIRCPDIVLAASHIAILLRPVLLGPVSPVTVYFGAPAWLVDIVIIGTSPEFHRKSHEKSQVRLG